MSNDKAYTRCPTCGTRGSRIQYGLQPGPPGPGVVLGGCTMAPDNPDFLCETCHTSWRMTADGQVIIVDLGAART